MISGSTKKSWLHELRDQAFQNLWAETYAWESDAAYENELLSHESDQNLELMQRAALMCHNTPAAFDLYLEGAGAGSVQCQQMVGWHYWTGTVIAADKYLAMQYYHSAICGGSWAATLCYARLLFEVGQCDDCERVLNDGVSYGFVPSYYWLALLRYKRRSTRAVRKEVRPLVEHAAKEGHPAAKDLLAYWMAQGKLRLRDIPRGWLMVVQDAIAQGRREAKD